MTPQSIAQLGPGSPAWLYAAVVAVLALHIAAGGAAILAGYSAVLLRKGGRAHRMSGLVFVLSMAVMAAMASLLSIRIGQATNGAGGMLALYLVATAWMAIRRAPATLGRLEMGALAFVAALTVMQLGFAAQSLLAARQPPGGSAAGPYLAFALLTGSFAAADIRMILRGGLTARQRLVRHAWRMCFALFFATGSFFIGQQKVMPTWMKGSPVLFALGLAPLGFILYWLVKLRRRPRSGDSDAPALAAEAAA